MFSKEDIYRLTKDFVAIGPRRCGYREDKLAAEFIEKFFKESGLENVVLEEFPINVWRLNGFSLEAEYGGSYHEVNCHPIWYSKPIKEKLTGETVYVGYGSLSEFMGVDVENKVVVVDSLPILNYYPSYKALQSLEIAAANGALAFIAIVNVPHNLVPIYTEDEDKGEKPIPGFLVGGDDGQLIKKTAMKGGSVRLYLDAWVEKGYTQDVYGYVYGDSDETIVVGTHYDSVYEGATDNAAGVAGFLSMARYFCRNRPSKTILFLASSGHEISVGARNFVKKHGDILDKTVAYITVDGLSSIGYVATYDGNVFKTGFDEKRGISVSGNKHLLRIAFEAVEKYRLYPAAYVPCQHVIFNPDLEGMFYSKGIPTLMIIGKPPWYHTKWDTIDKIDFDRLFEATKAYIEIIKGIDELERDELYAEDRKIDYRNFSELLEGEIRDREDMSISFSYLPRPAVSGYPTLFFVSDLAYIDDIIIVVRWDLGDGNNAEGLFVPHVFGSPGRFRVRLEAITRKGYRITSTKEVLVV